MGRALTEMGAAPQRMLASLEGEARGEALVEEAVPAELVAAGAVAELTAGIELERALARASRDDDAEVPAVLHARDGASVALPRPERTVVPRPASLATTSGASRQAIGGEPTDAPTSEVGGDERRAQARARARTWLAAKAARANASAAIDRPIELATPQASRSEMSMATARSARMPLAPSMERLAAALARLPGVAAASASPAARSSAAATRATAADLTGRHDRAPGVEDAPPARTARSEASLPWAGAPAPGRAARDPWPEAPPRSAPPRSAPPGATRAEPDEPALAESPMTGLRRFAMMAEADAPPAPAQVETTAALGPRGPSVPTHALPLDDVELSERITRVIRREARRDGIDLEPSS